MTGTNQCLATDDQWRGTKTDSLITIPIYPGVERQTMDFLFFASANHGVTRRLQEIMETVVPKENRVTYRDIQALSQRLCEPAERQRIVLLLVSSRQELSSIQSIRSLLSDESIIIVLPDREADTIAMGHSLHPRFLTYKDSDFTELAGVLVKMLTTPASRGT